MAFVSTASNSICRWKYFLFGLYFCADFICRFGILNTTAMGAYFVCLVGIGSISFRIWQTRHTHAYKCIKHNLQWNIHWYLCALKLFTPNICVKWRTYLRLHSIKMNSLNRWIKFISIDILFRTFDGSRINKTVLEFHFLPISLALSIIPISFSVRMCVCVCALLFVFVVVIDWYYSYISCEFKTSGFVEFCSKISL